MTPDGTPAPTAARWRQLALPFEHAPEFSAADLLASASNAEALAWLAPGAVWPQGRLALWGPEGSGKTHLLHVWAGRVGARLLTGAALPRAPEPPDGPIAVDEADAAAELALLHLLNAWAEAGLPVLLAARAPPARWTVALPDLASRLRAITAVDIRPPDDSLLRSLLARLLADRQLAVAEPVQEFLCRRLPRTPAAVREAAARLDRAALVAGRRVTRVIAADVLASMAETEAARGAPDHGAENEDFARGLSPAASAAPCLL
jgi:chromosomal replication initiation ATPase DnaA